jgi:hypothetical protein
LRRAANRGRHYIMQSLRVPGPQDVVRLLRPTVGEIVQVLTLYYEQQPGWSYGPARAMAEPVYSGELSLRAATEGCLTRGNPVGRRSNAEVANHIWAAAQGRNFHCHALAPRPFVIRSDLSIWVDPRFFFVEGGQVKIFWLQPRRRFSPTTEGLGTLATMIRTVFADDFENFDLELLDLSVPDGEKERARRIYRFAALPSLSEDVVTAALQRFAEAYDKVREMGVTRPARRPRRPDDHAGEPLFK